MLQLESLESQLKKLQDTERYLDDYRDSTGKDHRIGWRFDAVLAQLAKTQLNTGEDIQEPAAQKALKRNGRVRKPKATPAETAAEQKPAKVAYDAFPWLDQNYGNTEVFDFAWAPSVVLPSADKTGESHPDNIVSLPQEAALRKGIVHGFFDTVKKGGLAAAAIFVMAGCGINVTFVGNSNNSETNPTATATQSAVNTAQTTPDNDFSQYITGLTFPEKDPEYGNWAHEGGKIDAYLADFYGTTSGAGSEFDPQGDALQYDWAKEADPKQADRYNLAIALFNQINPSGHSENDPMWLPTKDQAGNVIGYKTLTREGWKKVFERAGGKYTAPVFAAEDQEQTAEAEEADSDAAAAVATETEAPQQQPTRETPFVAGINVGLDPSFVGERKIGSVEELRSQLQSNPRLRAAFRDAGVDPDSVEAQQICREKYSDLEKCAGRFGLTEDEIRNAFPVGTPIEMYAIHNGELTRTHITYQGETTNYNAGVLAVNKIVYLISQPDGTTVIVNEECVNPALAKTTIVKVTPTPSQTASPIPTAPEATATVAAAPPEATGTPVIPPPPVYATAATPIAAVVPLPPQQEVPLPPPPLQIPHPELVAVCVGLNNGQPNFEPIPINQLADLAIRNGINPNQDVQTVLRLLFQRNCQQQVPPPPIIPNLPVCVSPGVFQNMTEFDLRNLAAQLGLNPNLPVDVLTNNIAVIRCTPATSTPIPSGTPVPTSTIATIPPTGTPPPGATETATVPPTVVSPSPSVPPTGTPPEASPSPTQPEASKTPTQPPATATLIATQNPVNTLTATLPPIPPTTPPSPTHLATVVTPTEAATNQPPATATLIATQNPVNTLTATLPPIPPTTPPSPTHLSTVVIATRPPATATLIGGGH